MAYVIYDKGKKKVYLSGPDYYSLRGQFLKDKGICVTASIEMFSRSTCAKIDEQEWIDYLVNYFDEHPNSDLTSFDYNEEVAQKEIYEFLWDFCTIHSDYSMQKKGVQGIYRPSSIDIWLPNTFGKCFYLVHETTQKRFFRKITVVDSIYEIVPSEIVKIWGKFSDFSILFRDGTTLSFEDVTNNDAQSPVSITVGHK